MTTPALTLLSLALLLGVIGFVILMAVCRVRRARADAAYWRAAYVSVPSVLDLATTEELNNEIARRVNVATPSVTVYPATQDDGFAIVLRYGLDDRATADLLALAFEKVEGEAA